MNSDFARNFPRQLRFWAPHVPLNALPSFIIAISLFRVDKQSLGIFAMLAAIFIFILGLAAITSMVPDLNREGHPLARGLRAAVTFRAWVSGLSVGMLLISRSALMLVPDFWCGFIATGLSRQLMEALHVGSSPSPTSGFLPVMLTTVVEGVIIATGIAMLAFFLCLYFQSRERRKAFTSTGSPAHPR